MHFARVAGLAFMYQKHWGGGNAEYWLRFTNAAIKALPAQQRDAAATELEFSDTEVIGD